MLCFARISSAWKYLSCLFCFPWALLIPITEISTQPLDFFFFFVSACIAFESCWTFRFMTLKIYAIDPPHKYITENTCSIWQLFTEELFQHASLPTQGPSLEGRKVVYSLNFSIGTRKCTITVYAAIAKRVANFSLHQHPDFNSMIYRREPLDLFWILLFYTLRKTTSTII